MKLIKQLALFKQDLKSLKVESIIKKDSNPYLKMNEANYSKKLIQNYFYFKNLNLLFYRIQISIYFNF